MLLEVLASLARITWRLRSVVQTLAVHSNTFVAAFDPLEAHSILIGHLVQGPAESQTGELIAVLDKCQNGTYHDPKEPCITSKSSCFGRRLMVDRARFDGARHASSCVDAMLQYSGLTSHRVQHHSSRQGPRRGPEVLECCEAHAGGRGWV